MPCPSAKRIRAARARRPESWSSPARSADLAPLSRAALSRASLRRAALAWHFLPLRARFGQADGYRLLPAFDLSSAPGLERSFFSAAHRAFHVLARGLGIFAFRGFFSGHFPSLAGERSVSGALRAKHTPLMTREG